ncbi:MAG: DUF6268 family outer membrane beta-barrel protein [Planctomycetota bacterium]|nr:DUF6268 family outer membrane beta-barrel protein [Planctomycetota bacterium]
MLRRAAALVFLAALPPAALAQLGPPVPEQPADTGGAPARASDARASDDPAPQDASPRPDIQATLKLDVEHDFSADFDEAPGSVDVTRLRADMEVAIPLEGGRAFTISLTNEYSAYSFDDATGFVSGVSEPWDDVLDHQIALGYRTRLGERWGLFVGGSAQASYEIGATFGDSLTYAVRGGLSYAVNERTRVGLGVAVVSRLEDSAFVIPFPIIEWQFADRWTLRTTGASRGALLSLAFQATDNLELSLGAGIRGREFRLEDDGPVPDGVGSELGVPVLVAARWNITPQITLVAEAGAFVYRNYTLDDANGNELADIDTDIAPAARVGVSFNF